MVEATTSLEIPQPSTSSLLSVHGLTKRFPGVVANRAIDFDVRPGEVHALLGENGAGKTTLISMLYGLLAPDEGEIRFRSERVQFRSPKDAISAGIGLVAQHFLLVRRHTVAENIALGLPGLPLLFPTRRLKRRILETGERYGLGVDPNARIRDLSPGEQQRVEILKALMRGAKLLILDEPTGVLTPQEAERLFMVLKTMKREGEAVVFITHKLNEVMQVADRVTVLRKGEVVGQLHTKNTSPRELARLMVGREVVFERVWHELGPGAVMLKARDLWAKNERGVPALKGVSFDVREGEILGVAGVAGNGQAELIEVLTGLRRLERGTLELRGQTLAGLGARELYELGVAHIPEERLGVGVVPALSVADNLALRRYREPPFARGLWLDSAAIWRFSRESIVDYEIAAPSAGTQARHLSGGNIQKIILARELAGSPKLIVAAHPTYGLDVGASELTHKLLVEQRSQGAGVVLVSEDLEELLRLSDRILVLFAGEVMGVLEAAGASRERLGLMMAGERAAGDGAL